MLEMHSHIPVCKEPFENNSLSMLLFEVEEIEGNFSWNPGRLNYKQIFLQFEGHTLKMPVLKLNSYQNSCYTLKDLWLIEKTHQTLRNFWFVVKGPN